MTARTFVKLLLLSIFSYALASSTIVQAQDNVQAAPDRSEGEGPFDRLVIRGATLIDGTGAPAIGPVDIVIEGNRIVEVRIVGAPMLDIDPEDRPELRPEGLFPRGRRALELIKTRLRKAFQPHFSW